MASAAKFIDEIKNMSVIELSELIKELEDTFGVSASAPVAAVAAAAPVASAEAEKSEYKVVLTDAGSEKIKVIKALRTLTSLALGEAKSAVEGVPYTVNEAAPKEEAAKIKKTLEEAGAKVELS